MRDSVLSPQAAAAMKVLRAVPPAEDEERIAAGIVVLGSCTMNEGKDYPLENAIRELIHIGKPAVPKLIEELDKTGRDRYLRNLGFVLRGIGDPRAVPALIPRFRVSQPPSSDCGETVKNDPELLKFMQEHDNEKIFLSYVAGIEGASPAESKEFSYGRPVNEIMPALQKITGENIGFLDLVFIQLGESGEQNRIKRLKFQELGERWIDWWSKNWQKFVKDETEAQIAATRLVFANNAEELAKIKPRPLTKIPCGATVAVEEGEAFPFIAAFDDPRSPMSMMAFLNLNTGQMPQPSAELLKSSSQGKPSPELLSWAEKEGVSLIGIKFKPSGSEKSYYGFQPLGM